MLTITDLERYRDDNTILTAGDDLAQFVITDVWAQPPAGVDIPVNDGDEPVAYLRTLNLRDDSIQHDYFVATDRLTGHGPWYTKAVA